MPVGPPVLIQSIWLKRVGNYAVVSVEFPDGKEVEVIREHLDGQFSHNITEHGLLDAATGKRAEVENAPQLPPL